MDLHGSCGDKEKRLVKSLTAEIEGTLRNIRHQHLCPVMGCELVAGIGLFVISGYAPGGSVADWLVDAGPLAEPQIGRVLQAAVLGLEHLHSHGVLHTGLRGSNVLLGPGTAVRLADFGCTLRAGGLVDSTRRPWMSPELLAGGEPTEASDIWALGCLVVEMTSGRTPWALAAELAERTLEELLRQIATGADTPPLPKNISIRAQKFVWICLKHDVGSRPSAKKLLQEAFLEMVQRQMREGS
jgi:serine/threonine protein kinase